MTGRIRNFNEPPTDPKVKILGAPEAIAPESVQKLDSHSTVEQPPATLTVHEEVITISDKVRSKPPEPGETEVRVRHSPTQVDFDKVKRLEDE